MTKNTLISGYRSHGLLLVICLICLSYIIFLLGACVSKPDVSESDLSGLSLQEAIEQSAEKTAKELPQGSRVAVVAFDSGNYALSEYIMEEFNGALLDRDIEVVDRQNLAHVFQELNFQMSGYVSEETARSIGKFLGADIVITGQLTSFGNIYRYRTSAINVETAARVSITRFDVRDDPQLQYIINGGKR